ncbi:MAG: tRNA (adenosine(37)-N6)-dimethylallyltransferase MiaA [Bacteroidales bacterium]
MKDRELVPIILGPTASGKTAVAVRVAQFIDAEIISADSRQVYSGMDIGTGKDLDEYVYHNNMIPYHLIDIVPAGYKYNLYEFMQDFLTAYSDIVERHKTPLVCGGTGMYVESIIKKYNLLKVPENTDFREKCEHYSYDELVAELSKYKTMHNTSDIDSKKRLIRALEIATYEYKYGRSQNQSIEVPYEPCVIGINLSRDVRRKRISQRLYNRLDEGLLNEVYALLEKGVSHEVLQYYGLEYKFASLYIQKQISYSEFTQLLQTAIFQFAKRQMTWFRGMERRGIRIHWVDGELPVDEQVNHIVCLLTQKS